MVCTAVVHGGWSDWQRWEPCNGNCTNPDSVRIRKKICTKPVPRLGGDDCEPSVDTIEETDFGRSYNTLMGPVIQLMSRTLRFTCPSEYADLLSSVI